MTHPAQTLRSGAVELRAWHRGDTADLDRLVTESREHLLPWMPFAATHSTAQAADFLDTCVADHATGQAYNYAITTQGVKIGSCGLMRRIGPGGLDIGYWLHPAWTGRGLATMAAAALVAAGRNIPGTDRIEIHHDEANPASGAVARRLGFTEVDRVRRTDPPAAPGDTGTDVIWRLRIPESPVAQASHP